MWRFNHLCLSLLFLMMYLKLFQLNSNKKILTQKGKDIENHLRHRQISMKYSRQEVIDDWQCITEETANQSATVEHERFSQNLEAPDITEDREDDNRLVENYIWNSWTSLCHPGEPGDKSLQPRLKAKIYLRRKWIWEISGLGLQTKQRIWGGIQLKWDYTCQMVNLSLPCF